LAEHEDTAWRSQGNMVLLVQSEEARAKEERRAKSDAVFWCLGRS
jgi:hypothetical protein